MIRLENPPCARDVACPFCGARKGQRCAFKSTGRKTAKPHRARVRNAYAQHSASLQEARKPLAAVRRLLKEGLKIRGFKDYDGQQGVELVLFGEVISQDLL